MKTLEFDFVAWKNFTKDLGREPSTAEHKKYFKGDAYPLAFPLYSKAKKLLWVLNGEVLLWDGEAIEFEWRAGAPMTFNEFLKRHAQEWARMMSSESRVAPLSIQCCAGVL